MAPFPREGDRLAWQWAMEAPSHNFDDYGPRTFGQFQQQIESRRQTERTWGVTLDGRLCGYVGFVATSDRIGITRGILFARDVHGQGIARAAVGRIFAGLFDEGIHKIQAAAFASNHQVDRFLRKLGAVEEGYLRDQTMRGGQPADIRLAAIFKAQFRRD